MYDEAGDWTRPSLNILEPRGDSCHVEFCGLKQTGQDILSFFKIFQDICIDMCIHVFIHSIVVMVFGHYLDLFSPLCD